MKRAIREHRVDFAAIFALLIMAAGVSTVILSHQRLTLPGWVPIVGKDFYEFKGAFQTGQAVTPGQGQTVNVAGVKVGEIARVDLVDGRAVLGLRLSDTTIVVHRDATMLLRPKTGLKDMTVELDPGSAAAPKLPEHGTIGVGQTQPDVNLDEFLSALDGDTRVYLQALLNAGAQGLRGRGRDLGDAIRTFGPTARALRRINAGLATRRENIKRVMHNFSLVADELGRHDDDLARFVDSNGAVLASLARSEANLRATLRGLPPALSDTRSALGRTGALASELGPSLAALDPAARRLGPTLRQVRPFFSETTPVIRDSVRPLVRAARPLVSELRPTTRSLAKAVPDLFRSLKVINTALDMLAYNPPGDQEGYLFWLSWANHLGASVFASQDAHGPIRRGALVVGCSGLAILNNVAAANAVLGTTIGLLNIVKPAQVCAAQQGQTPGGRR